MGNVILFGAPMALLIAEEDRTLEKVGIFNPGTFRGRGKCGDRPDKAWPPGRIPDPAGKIPSDIILQIRSKRTGLERSGSPMIRYTVPGSS